MIDWQGYADYAKRFLEDALGHVLVIEKDASATVTLTSAHAMLGDGTFRLFGARRIGAGVAATVEERVNGAVEAMQTGSAAGLDLRGDERGSDRTGQ